MWSCHVKVANKFVNIKIPILDDRIRLVHCIWWSFQQPNMTILHQMGY